MRRLVSLLALAPIALSLGIYPILSNNSVTFLINSQNIITLKVFVYKAFVTSVEGATVSSNVIVWSGKEGSFSFTVEPQEGSEIAFVAYRDEKEILRGFLSLKGGCLGFWYGIEGLREGLGFSGIGQALTISVTNLCSKPLNVPVTVKFSYGSPSKSVLMSYCKESKEVYLKVPKCLLKTCTRFIPGKLICVRKVLFPQREVFSCNNCYFTKVGKVCKECFLVAKYPKEACSEYLAVPKCASWKCSLIGYEYVKKEICTKGSFVAIKGDLDVVGNSVTGIVRLEPNSTKALVIPFVPPKVFVLGFEPEVSVPLATIKVGNFTSYVKVTYRNQAFLATTIFYALTLLALAVLAWRALG